MHAPYTESGRATSMVSPSYAFPPAPHYIPLLKEEYMMYVEDCQNLKADPISLTLFAALMYGMPKKKVTVSLKEIKDMVADMTKELGPDQLTLEYAVAAHAKGKISEEKLEAIEKLWRSVK